MSRPWETDGCSELTCMYHGEENRRKKKEYEKEAAKDVPGVQRNDD